MKILLPVAPGGHYSQAISLAPVLARRNSLVVATLEPGVEPAAYVQSVLVTKDPGRRPIAFAVHCARAAKIFLRERPDAVLTTGAGNAIPFLVLARALGTRTVFIESFSRLNAPSISGRIAYHIVDFTFYQWPGLRSSFPKGRLIPPLVPTEMSATPMTDPDSIFVTVGKHPRGMDQLIEAIDQMVIGGILPPKVLAQIGYGTYRPSSFNWVAFLPHEELLGHMMSAGLVVAHAGAGTLMECSFRRGPTVIVPRRESRGEHVNDHQLEMAQEFGSRPGFEVVTDLATLKDALLSPHPAAPGVRWPTASHAEIVASLGIPIESAFPEVSHVHVGPVPVARMTLKEIVSFLIDRAQNRSKCNVVSISAWQLVLAHLEPRFRTVLADRALNICDGSVPLFMSRIQGTGLPERTSGVDLFLEVCKAASLHQMRVFLLGADQRSMKGALSELRRRYGGLCVAGFSPPIRPEFSAAETTEMVEAANAFEADFLFVAMGTPKGEYWIQRNLDRIDAPVAASIGGALDNVSRIRLRAPAPIRFLGMEGLFRFLQEPKRRWVVASSTLRMGLRLFPGLLKQGASNGRAHDR